MQKDTLKNDIGDLNNQIMEFHVVHELKNKVVCATLDH